MGKFWLPRHQIDGHRLVTEYEQRMVSLETDNGNVTNETTSETFPFYDAQQGTSRIFTESEEKEVSYFIK